MSLPTFRDPALQSSPKDRILETARLLFYSRGINNVGIDLIIAESGVAKATLYKHFKSKDDLIVAYMQQGDLRWLSWLGGRIEAQAPDPAHRLMALWSVLEEWFALPLFRGCLLTNVVTELAPPPQHPARAALLEHKEKVRAYFEALAQQAGTHHPREVSEQWMVLMEGATVIAARERTTQSATQAQAMAQILLEAQGVASPRAEPEIPNPMLEHLDFEF